MKTTLGKLWLGELTPWSEAEEEYEDVLRYAEILEACFETLMEQLDEEGKNMSKHRMIICFWRGRILSKKDFLLV